MPTISDNLKWVLKWVYSMPKIVAPLTDKQVTSLKKKGLYSVGGVVGLKLQVKSLNARSWILRVKFEGKTHDIGLGSYPSITLKTAREEAQRIRDQIYRGLNPIVEREKLNRQLMDSNVPKQTFQQCADAYIDEVLRKGVGQKSIQQWTNTLSSYAFPFVGQIPVSEVTKANLVEILKPLWETKHETAARLRGRIERILDYAAAHGYREGSNPAVYKGNLEAALPTIKKKSTQHHPSLSYTNLAKFMKSLATVSGTAAKALQFGILTAARSGEVRGATWQEINWDEQTWTIPADRMKAGKEHVVPLSPKVLEILRSCEPSSTGLIFHSKKGNQLSDAALAKVIKDMHERSLQSGYAGWTDPDAENRVVTPHGFRSTFRVWAADTIDLPSDIVEHALAHQLKDKVEAAYQRKSSLPKRIKLMQAWADFCFASRVLS